MIAEKPQDGNWLAWVNRNYGFDERWQEHLLKRTELPKPGSAEQLDDLRGIASRETAAMLAELWFYSVEHTKDIEKEQALTRERERETDRKRLIHIASLALDGKLGDTRDARDAAMATAQQFLGMYAPDQCDYDTLRDWDKMHHYALEVAKGGNPQRPKLSRDRKREAAQRREMADVEDAIDAVPAGRPRAEYAQQGFGY
jgi:hypothetical protein